MLITKKVFSFHESNKNSPTRIRTEDTAFKVLGDNHFTIGDVPHFYNKGILYYCCISQNTAAFSLFKVDQALTTKYMLQTIKKIYTYSFVDVIDPCLDTGAVHPDLVESPTESLLWWDAAPEVR